MVLKKQIDYEQIEILRDYVLENECKLNVATIKSFEEDFAIRFNHESTKLEGNTYTIFEVKTLLTDKISIGGKALREQYEIINNNKANEYVLQSVKNGKDFNEDIIKDIHQIIMDNILLGGIYRTANVKITGASFTPVQWTFVREEMKSFIQEAKELEKELNPIEYASYIHAEFVRIHPFEDGNGRTARMLLNFILMKNKYKPVSINTQNKLKYYESLDLYGRTKTYKEISSIKNFYELILEIELQNLMEYKNEIDTQIQ